jgi:Uma2 family endonuclease
MTLATPIQAGHFRAASPIEEALARASIVPLTIEQYERMIEEGIVPEDSTVELLRGVLVRKDRSVIGEDPMGHSPLHKLVVVLLTALAARINNERQHLQIQLPVVCPPYGEPEPDASIVRGTPRDYADRLPGPGDVTCVIEAAHSSLERDREDKSPSYAAAGIGQYVIINLQNMTVEVYEEPDAAGEEYRKRTTLERGEKLGFKLAEGVVGVEVGELLP